MCARMFCGLVVKGPRVSCHNQGLIGLRDGIVNLTLAESP